MNIYQSGTFKKHFSKKEYEYKSFYPSPINKTYDWEDKEITLLLAEAQHFLGELNAYSKLIPNVDFFIQMHVKKEATKSAKIEGTKTGLDEVVSPKEEIAPEKRDDWEEVQNYIQAINYSIVESNKLPLCVRLIKNAHEILLSGVRGKEKQPGEIRQQQNWIGGSSIRDAFFIPPHQEDLPALLTDLETFWHNESIQIPQLIKIAISHYQFETIHPFNDGNGRIGRLLIVLQLVDYNILKKPVLYLSDFLEKNRSEYYDALMAVRTSGEMEHWIKFFLSGLIETAQKGKDTLEGIIQLNEVYKQKLMLLGNRAKLGQKLMLELFSQPVLNTKMTAKLLGVTFPTANNLIAEMQKQGILKEVTGFSRNKLFTLWEYLELFEK
jgi:Fic family protein